jgi:hypothetical protein
VPEQVNATTITIAAWRVGSVLISNANCRPGECGKGGNHVKKYEECDGEGRSCKRKERGTMQLTKVAPMASAYFVGVGKNLVVRK